MPNDLVYKNEPCAIANSLCKFKEEHDEKASDTAYDPGAYPDAQPEPDCMGRGGRLQRKYRIRTWTWSGQLSALHTLWSRKSGDCVDGRDNRRIYLSVL